MLVYVDTGWNKQQAAIAGQGIMWMSVWCENILNKKKSLSRDSSMLEFFKSPSGTAAAENWR